MKSSLRILMSLMCIVVALSITSCSVFKNREKESSDEAPKGASISVKVVSRSTTVGTKTTKTIDSDIEKKITKTLTKSLINGLNDRKLFTKDAFKKASSTFLDNNAALNNDVEVSFFHWSNKDKNKDIVVADISQTIQDKNKNKITNNGKIYFNNDGLIMGFDLKKQTPNSASPDSKDEA